MGSPRERLAKTLTAGDERPRRKTRLEMLASARPASSGGVAGELDRSARSDHRIGRRPMIAVMAKSGLRVGEACALQWRCVDTTDQRLVIEHAKTAAGIREVDLSLDLLDELNVWRVVRTPLAVDEQIMGSCP
jgi:integrase